MLKYDVLCIGSATVDHFLITEKPLSKVHLGDKVLVKSIESHSGGGGTNSAAGLSRLGLKVKVLTKIGDDHDGSLIKKELVKYGVKNICLNYSLKSTDSSTVLSSTKEKDRIILVHKGASQDLGMHDFKVVKLKSKWIYLATTLGKSFQTSKKIIKYAKENKIKILFNPSSYLASKGKSHLNPILSVINILVLNKEEAQSLLGKKEITTKLLLNLNKLGPETVIITDGPKKLHAYNHGTIYCLIPPDEKVVQTAGAGDAFTSGFLAGIIKKYPFELALQLGQANAQSVIKHIGTKNKLLDEAEAKRMIKKYRMKITKQKVS